MKTSNKLLISFGTLFVIVPIIGMMLTAKLYYKVAVNNESHISDPVLNYKSFKEKTLGRTSIPIKQPFYAVNIVDGNNSSIELHLIQENNYGVKIQEYLVKDLDFKVEKGVLNIYFKNGLSNPDILNRVMITAYAPNFEVVSAKHTMDLNLVTSSESLNINLKDCAHFSIGKDLNSSTVIEGVNGDTLNNKTKFKNLRFNLDHSTLAIRAVQLDRLNIKAQGNSTVDMDGAGSNIKESTIGYFILTTIDSNIIKIRNFKPKEMKGEISEETKLDASTSVLRGILKSHSN